MDNSNFEMEQVVGSGIPFDDLVWEDIPGNPFGRAANFNAIIFGDANNIVDVKGALAVGGSFYSQRGLSLNFGWNIQSPEYTPDNVGFLVGGNVAMNGSLVVVGQVIIGGGFRAARGSTFLIGKDGSSAQASQLAELYRANGQSRYWSPSDRGNHYIISSYDVPHYLPASRINVNLTTFFQDAKASIENYKECIENLPVNGIVEEDFHEWVLIGNDPDLNIFVLDRRPNGLINKGIRFDVPDTSTIIVRLQTGPNAHLQYGLYGSESQASRTIYLFEDATNIYMEVPADIWGSFLAPNAMLHGHRTGGHITGNLALGSFAVSPTSGFEFHLPVFEGQVFCEEVSDIVFERPEEVPIPVPTQPPVEEPIIEEPIIEEPIIEEPEPPIPTPSPARPPRERRPIPTLPEDNRRFIMPSPPQEPEPCPPCPEPRPCPPCQECLIQEGVIAGCIWGCECHKRHGWIVELYEICANQKVLVDCVEIGHYGCFKFYVPYDGCYCLSTIPSNCMRNQPYYYRSGYSCKPIMSLNNIGVSNFYY